MDVGVYPYAHGDPLLIDKIVNEFLSQGKFDKLRKECMSDADTKPAYQNLQQRVESTVTQFLKKQVWRPDLNKNHLRDSLRKHILESGFFDAGINRIVDQVVNPNVLATVFLPEVEEVVYSYLSIPRPVDKTPRKVPPSASEEKIKPSGFQENSRKDKSDTNGGHQVDSTKEDKKGLPEKITENSDTFKTASLAEDKSKENENVKNQPVIKTENLIKSEPEDSRPEENVQTEIQGSFAKMELVSDDSQESLSRIGVERLQINETETVAGPDSDDSIPLEINEKTMSDSRDSDDSIMNQMSPISQGRLTPDILEDVKIEMKADKIEVKEEKEKVVMGEEKRPLTFIGRIPKLKREDSESSKSSKKEETPRKSETKNMYSSDESDSTKSFEKSDSDDRKGRDKKKEERKSHKDDRRQRDEPERRRKHEDTHKSSKDKSKDRKREDKSKESKDKKRDRSRDRHGDKKSSSSSSSSHSRDKSSSHHKSSHQSHHRDSKSRDGRHDRKRKEEEKKKSKSTDDHGKERNKKEDRRSTDRDSNERERDKTSGGRSQAENRKREKEEKTEESKGERPQKEEEQVEAEVNTVTESEEVVLQIQGDWIPDEEIVLVNEVQAENHPELKEPILKEPETLQKSNQPEIFQEGSLVVLDFTELYQNGSLTRVEFPKLTDDFYVKFNSTGFKYFEEWEQLKLDCEEEFKEFVDEAENNLDLISDDDSDDFSLDEENRQIIKNSLEGLGNFRKCLMFDPKASEFYKWANNKFYHKYQKKADERRNRHVEKNESDESKENIDKIDSEDSECHGEKNKENHAREKKALHLKLLKRYRRKAMRQGKHKRRPRRRKILAISGGIKEKNDNQNTSGGCATNKAFETDAGYLYRDLSETETYSLQPLSGKMSGIEKLESGSFSQLEENTRICEKSVVCSTVIGKPETVVTNELKKAVACLNTGGFMGNVCKSEVNTERILVNGERFDGGFLSNDGNVLSARLKDMFARLPGSPDESRVSPDLQKKKKGIRLGLSKPKSKSPALEPKEDCLKSTAVISQKFNLPLSPDSDDVNASGMMVSKPTTNKRKRIHKTNSKEGTIPKKQSRRNYNQKYDSQDLYKPRPVLNTSRTRGRERVLELEKKWPWYVVL